MVYLNFRLREPVEHAVTYGEDDDVPVEDNSENEGGDNSNSEEGECGGEEEKQDLLHQPARDNHGMLEPGSTLHSSFCIPIFNCPLSNCKILLTITLDCLFLSLSICIINTFLYVRLYTY